MALYPVFNRLKAKTSILAFIWVENESDFFPHVKLQQSQLIELRIFVFLLEES